MPKFDPNKSPAYVVLFAALVSAAFTAAIMALHVTTKPVVERNQKVLREKSIVDAFGLGDVETMDEQRIVDTYARQVLRVPLSDSPTSRAYYFAFRADGPPTARPFAFAIPLHGVGFWAPIEGLLAVQTKTRKAIGVVFLEHGETPGLGGRITERDFRDRWKGLNLQKPAEGDPCVYVTKSQPRRGGPMVGRHVDALSGATGTSTAVMKFTNASIREYLAEAEAMAGRVTRADIDRDTPLPPVRGEGVYTRGGN